MPAAAPLFTGSRILGTAHRYAVVPARDAYVAADAFPDLVFPAVLVFFWQDRIPVGGLPPPNKTEVSARTCETITSGEVKRPTPTTGRLVNCLTKLTTGSWLPSGANREGPKSGGPHT